MTQESSQNLKTQLTDQTQSTVIITHGAGADTPATTTTANTTLGGISEGEREKVQASKGEIVEHASSGTGEKPVVSSDSTLESTSADQALEAVTGEIKAESDQSSQNSSIPEESTIKSATDANHEHKKIELSPAPHATVGTIEVDGLKIEMVSLSQIREQNLALEQAQAEAKAAGKQKRKSSSTGTTKRTRKPKAQAVEEQEVEASNTQAELAQSKIPNPSMSTNTTGSEKISEDSTASLAQVPKKEQSSTANEIGHSASSERLESSESNGGNTVDSTKDNYNETNGAKAKYTEDTVKSTEAENPENTEPSLAQTLLSQLISNVEQQEIKASQVSYEDMERAADAATHQQELEGQDNSKDQYQAQTQDKSSSAPKQALFPEPEWADMDELTPEQIERYSHMGLQEGDICPLCSNGILMLRHSYKADFLGCSNFPNCKFHLFTGKRSPVVTLRELNSFCPECHGQLEVKKGRFGIFIGCSNYPACTYVYRRKDEAPVSQIACPICHEGYLVERRGRSGKTFYGCNNFPSCTFSLFGTPVEEKCEECGFSVMYQKKVKNGIALICGDPNCPSHKKRKRQMFKTEQS